MIDDQFMFDRFHAAYDFEPRAGSVERFKATIISAEAERRWPKGRFRLPVASRRLIAGVVLVGLVAASVGAFISINRYVHRPVPVGAPAYGIHPISFGNLTPVQGRNSFYFTGNDAVVVSSGGHPLITHDGGKTWLQTPATFFYGSMEWIDARHIYFWGLSTNHAINHEVPGGVIFEETADGGMHWQFLPARSASAIFDPTESFFLDAEYGWSLQWGCQVNEACAVSRTLDAGATWEQIASVSSGHAAPAEGILFTDTQHGFTGSASEDGIGRLYTTSDSGNTWDSVDLPPPSGGWQGGLNVVGVPQMFGQAGVVIAHTNIGDWWLYTTVDGGATWRGPRLIPVRVETNPGPVFVSSNEGWLVDGHGALLRSLDAGASWQQVRSDAPRGSWLAVTPVGGQALWGLVQDGSSMFAVRSTDDGLHWNLVSTPARVGEPGLAASDR